MLPHALRFSHMVMLCCDMVARIVESEAVWIGETLHFLARASLICRIGNRSGGLDGPVLCDYQFLCVCFNWKWAQGHDIDAEQDMLNSLVFHKLPYLDAGFVEKLQPLQ